MTVGPRRVRARGVGPFTFRQIGIAFGAVAIAGIVLVAVTRPLGQVGSTGAVDPRQTFVIVGSVVPGFEPGQLAPELRVHRSDGSTFQLMDLDGHPIRLADLRGKAVWVNFWTSWCPPCQSETPVLRQVYETYRDRGLALVAINVQETVDVARDYAQRYDLPYTIGADVSGDVFRAYRGFGLPTQLFIDPQGVIRFVVKGPLDVDGASQRVEAILPAGTAPSGSALPSAAPTGS